MILPFTKEALAAAYDYLSELPPFNGWALPPSDEITFSVYKRSDRFAHYRRKDDRHYIAVSNKLVGTHQMLLSTLSHEIIHLHLTEMETRGDPHGPKFTSLAEDVCLLHGFDFLNF